MSLVPSNISEHFAELDRHNFKVISVNSNIDPIFTIKEDNFITLKVHFKPNPVCVCSHYYKSSKKTGHSICHHILYILINYYHINLLSLKMYHKLPTNFYETLLSYFDIWLNTKFTSKELKSNRKKGNNPFQETATLVESKDNLHILNPMYNYYTQTDCAICLDALCSKKLLICPECNNYTHYICAQQWLQKKQGCHLCRNNPIKYYSKTSEEFPTLASVKNE
jgi:hypothetical protein